MCVDFLRPLDTMPGYPNTVSNDYSTSGHVTLAAFAAYQAQLNAAVAAAVEVNDAVTGTTTTWSSTKLTAELAVLQ